MTYSLETVIQIWNDKQGSRIEVGHDKDSLGLMQIRSIDAQGNAEREITMTLAEAILLQAAIGDWLKSTGPRPQPE